MDRHNARAYLMRQWRADAAQEELENKRRTRFQTEQRLQRLQARFEAAETEKELEKRTCSLCRMVRAEAWGLGHTRWKERQCSKCWAASATLRSQQRRRPHTLQRSCSDGECGFSGSSRAARHNRNHMHAHATDLLSPRHAGYAAARSRIVEGLALLGVPLAPPSMPNHRPGRHGGSRWQKGLSHSYSFAPDWGAVARRGAVLGDPREWQQPEMMEHHAFKNDLLMEQSVEESLHPVSRSARLYPPFAQPPGSTSAHVREPMDVHSAASPTQVHPSRSPFPAHLPHEEAGHEKRSVLSTHGRAPKRSSNDGSSSGSENSGAKSHPQRRQGRHGGGDAQRDGGRQRSGSDSGSEGALGRASKVLDAEDLCAAVRSRDAEKLLSLLGPRMLEELLEGCLGNSLPSPGYANEGSKPAPAINTDGRAVDGLQPHPQQQTASDQHRSSHTTTQHVLLSSTPRHPERHQHQFTGTQSMLSMPWTQRRNPQNQHLHQHRHHAANAAQVEWAGSLRCMPDPESNEVSIQGLLQGRGWAPEMKDAARRAAVSAQKERRGWEAHVGMSWRGRTHQADVLNAGLGAREGEVLKGQGHEEDHTPLKGEEGLGLADSGGMVLPQQQKQQQRQQQLGEQRSPVEGEGSKVKVRDEAAQQGLAGSSGGAPSKQARQGQQHQYQRQRQRMQEGLGEDEALTLGIAPKERKRRKRDLGREERMRADLKQAEHELVMACTQEGRTAALFLACTLREELARLSRHNRCYRKLLETRKHSARANTRDQVFGIKHVVGRQHPPETALPIAYDCHGYPRYAHEVLQAACPSSKSGDAGDADARLGVGAGRGKHGAASGGGLPEDGIVNATGLKPAVRAPAQQQQQQQQQQGARKSSTAAAKGHASSGDISSDDGHSDGRASPDLTPAKHPHRNFPALLEEKTEHHPSHQQSSTSANREWGPGHPHTNYPRAPRHLQHPHFISDPCYAASPDPHYHPVLYPPGRLSSSFDPHHNLTHYQMYSHRYRHRKHHHQHAPPAAVAPQAQPRHLGTNYLGADDYSEAPPRQHRYQSRAASAAEAAVARLRDPFGYGTPNQMRDLAWTQIHPATPDPLLMADQVPFKPQASKTSVSRPGAINDADPQRAWEDLFSGVLQGYSQGARAKKDQDWAEAVAAWLCKSQRERVQESKQLRAMPIDDFKLQLRKEREWQRAVGEVQSLLLADGGDRGHANLEADEVHKDTQNLKGGE